ncbi:MAG: 50S ribosomal protein L23 [Patescibacteria group bacterium]|nr:50S ribosomal protein L23 [Patescibacteria group bacterium]MDE1966060.1 50S ribosomal protein L23 [Patescibacteria group bacterium]
MALFAKQTKKEEKKPASAALPATGSTRTGREHTTLLAPWFSEKALLGTEKGVYVFGVPKEATKHDVERAILHIYKVAPAKVRIVNLPAKTVSLRTRRGTGTRSIRRKAYVYLKKGETISLA